MLRFITYLQVTPKLKNQVKFTTVAITGLLLGYWKGQVVNDKYKDINSSKLIEYETQDQINTMIEKQQKPAVIYYCLPIHMDHAFFREMMFKYSNLYSENAIWTMVSLHKNFQQAKSSFDYQYLTRTMLEVRFPKSQVAIKLGDNGEFMELKEKAHRREGFKYNAHEEGFKKFLEENRVIEAKDPMKSVFNITQKALFGTIQKVAGQGKK